MTLEQAKSKVIGQYENNLQKMLKENDYYDPDLEPEKYKNYWQAKRQLDQFLDSDYNNNPFIIQQAKALMAEENDKPYTPVTSKSGRYIKVPLRSQNEGFYTSEHVPGNGRLAENVVNPITGDILARRGYWPTYDDLSKWYNENGIEYLTYTVRPEDAAGELSDEDNDEIQEMYKR